MLSDHHLSSVPVIDPQAGKCIGSISLGDVNRLNTQKANLKVIYAREACTFKPIVVAPDVSAEAVARLMVEHRIHHVIVARDNKLMGFVSSLDIIAACLGIPLH